MRNKTMASRTKADGKKYGEEARGNSTKESFSEDVKVMDASTGTMPCI